MKEVELPDGRIAEFPDGMSNDQIAAILRGGSTPKEPSSIAGGWTGALGGIIRGIRDPIDAGAQLLVRGANKIGLAPDSEVSRVDQINRDAERDYRQNWRQGQPIGFDAARLAGNIVGTAPMAYATPAGAGMGLFGRTALGGATGAGFGALSPVDTENGKSFADQKLDQMKSGAMFGAAAAPITAAFSRVISPKSSDQVQTLLSEGVVPTPGQALGGAFKSFEEKLTSVPVIGDMIRNAQKRGWQDLERAAANRSLEPLGETIPKNLSGWEAISYTKGRLQDAYNSALTKIGTPAVDNQMLGELSSLNGLVSMLPKDKGELLDRIVGSEILGRTQNGRLTGEAIKAAEGNLGRQASAYMRSPDWDTRKLGEAVSEAQNILRSWVERNAATPEAAAELQKVNLGWANFKRIERAASSVAAEGGNYTPSMLNSAVKAMDRSKDKSSFAQGNALMQDLSSAGKTVLADTVRNSGTADRLAAIGTIGGLSAASHFLSPWMAAPLALTPAYTQLGQNAITSLLARRPEEARAIAKGLLDISPGLSGLLGLGGTTALQYAE